MAHDDRRCAEPVYRAKMLRLPILACTVFPSDPLRQTYAQLRLPIYLGEMGCWLEAPSGDGKSTAIEYCNQSLLAEFPHLPVLFLNEHMHPAASIRSFPGRLLAEIRAKYTGETYRLRRRLARRLAELARAHPMRQVILLLDEGQAILEQDLRLIKDLANDLDALGARLLTVTFGEWPTMGERVETALAGKEAGVAARVYGGHQLRLVGYESKDDWASVLRSMDTCKLEELGNETATAFFFGGNFRLESEADRLWEAIDTARRNGEQLNLRRNFTGIRWVLEQAAQLETPAAVFARTDIWSQGIAYGLCTDGMADENDGDDDAKREAE